MTENARAALVTGGTGRVGGVITARLEAEGFAVLAAGRRDGVVSRPEEARALVERAAKEFGGLDLLVNAVSDGFEPRLVEEVSSILPVGSTTFVRRPWVEHVDELSVSLTRIRIRTTVAPGREWLVEGFFSDLLK